MGTLGDFMGTKLIQGNVTCYGLLSWFKGVLRGLLSVQSGYMGIFEVQGVHKEP